MSLECLRLCLRCSYSFFAFHVFKKRNDEHAKELWGDLSNIGQTVDSHAISIKHLELQIVQISTTGNPRQVGTLPSNTVHNLKNHGHCIAVITWGGKETIDPPMPSSEEYEVRKDDNGELVDKAVKGEGYPKR